MSDERITQMELDLMLKKHKTFMSGRNGGARMVYKFKNLSGLDFRQQNLSGADFTGSDLSNCNLLKTNCNGTIFYGCNLQGATLNHATFDRTDFRGADLTDTYQVGVDLSKADLRKGKVSQAVQEVHVHAPVVTLKMDTQNHEQRVSDLVLKGETYDHRETDLSLDAGKDGGEARHSDLVLKGDITSGERVSDLTLKGDDVQARVSALLLSGDDDHARASDLVLTGDVITGRDSDLDLSITPEEWDEMTRQHYAWLSSGGLKGKQMDLSKRDLRTQKDIAQTAMTLIKGTDCKFDELYLVKAQMQGGNFKDSSVTNVHGQEADFRGSNLAGVNFSGADLSGAHFEWLVIRTARGDHKIKTNLDGANFSGAKLVKARFKGAILTNVDFRGADITGADFREADLTGAKFDA